MFDLATSYVTVACYKHPMLVHDSGKYMGLHPFVFEPLFAHNARSTSDYTHFFHALIEQNADLKDIQALGSDGEVAILNAKAIVYPDAIKLKYAEITRKKQRGSSKRYSCERRTKK